MGYSYTLVNIKKPHKNKIQCVELSWFGSIRYGMESSWIRKSGLKFKEFYFVEYKYGQVVFRPINIIKHLFWFLKNLIKNPRNYRGCVKWMAGIIFISINKNYAFVES